MPDVVRDYWTDLTGPLQKAWIWYGTLDPEQQRSLVLLAGTGVVGVIAWVMYQTHGDDVVIVLPATVLRLSLLLLALPVLMVGRMAGAGWEMPGVLRRSWTARPDPDEPKIRMQEVNPMRLPGGLTSREKKAWKERFVQ
ncbi:Hypothetical Protein RradSPS_3108 (plasmid) [Rubrobacter radiotolerans]|uniref:Uncharacterized protein n=1 Tax=Rubrobacter radiotolerans TaxID=42256 RepID=A0A023X847_RUBRA|nr:hypothetical protein [Rubrobacter radiotolerans]AHY48391.1 Hypothetical Protein RradSPS_3108 [Rubrobacter radiotolerans]MDX5895632.1 hypothetical protein [Rubrobacter radiotolerans]SMC01403.1 hypothetical protein SAMN00767673_3221 [Rubrobacter radiotolerans DSM 5868]